MKKAGFTLIELLVMIGIITIMAGLALASYNSFGEEKKLENESKRLLDVLELGRKKTASGDTGGNSCQDFIGYKITISANNYLLELVCAENTYSVQQYTIPQNLQITQANTVTIKPISGEFSFTSNVITIKHTYLNKCIDVSMMTTGTVSEGNKYAC